jgi:hypothetical protein
MDKGLSVVLEVGSSYRGAFIATQRRPAPKSDAASRLSRAASRSRQWIEGRSKPLNVRRQKRRRITERLAGRVKGLTARFDVLLVTLSACGRLRAARAETRKNNG